MVYEVWPESSSGKISSFPEAKVNARKTLVITPPPPPKSEYTIIEIPCSASRIQGQLWSNQEILIFAMALRVDLALIRGAGPRVREEL